MRQDLPRRHGAHRGKRDRVEKRLAGGESWVAREENAALSDTHRTAGKRKDETGTLSAEPWCEYYRIRYYLSSEKLKAVD